MEKLEALARRVVGVYVCHVPAQLPELVKVRTPDAFSKPVPRSDVKADESPDSLRAPPPIVIPPVVTLRSRV